MYLHFYKRSKIVVEGTLLDHERGHVAIAEQGKKSIGDELIKNVTGTGKDCDDFEKAKRESISHFNRIIAAAFNAAKALVDKRQNNYENDTKHGLDLAGQAKWDKILFP